MPTKDRRIPRAVARDRKGFLFCRRLMKAMQALSETDILYEPKNKQIQYAEWMESGKEILRLKCTPFMSKWDIKDIQRYDRLFDLIIAELTN